MNSRRSDFELLKEFVRGGDQVAFADVVRRHVDLVFGTAMRKVQDEGAAQEVAQNVFSALAKKAWQFASDDSVPAWLYRTTLLEAQEWLRGELRRRRREQTAAELGTTMNTQNEGSTYRTFLPLLDEALLSLREKDRTALLLRFFEGQSLREIGASLGVGEDAAQKRVASALDKVASFFQRRGFQTVTATAITVAFEKSAVSASAASASLIVNASLQAAPSALSGLTALLARVTSLSKVQTAAVCAGIAILSVGWQWNQAHASAKEAALAHQRTDELMAAQEQAVSELDRLRTKSLRLEKVAASAAQSFAR
jgi:RNA polymerase sigma factor (sigma-70 family)